MPIGPPFGAGLGGGRGRNWAFVRTAQNSEHGVAVSYRRAQPDWILEGVDERFATPSIPGVTSEAQPYLRLGSGGSRVDLHLPRELAVGRAGNAWRFELNNWREARRSEASIGDVLTVRRRYPSVDSGLLPFREPSLQVLGVEDVQATATVFSLNDEDNADSAITVTLRHGRQETLGIAGNGWRLRLVQGGTSLSERFAVAQRIITVTVPPGTRTTLLANWLRNNSRYLTAPASTYPETTNWFVHGDGLSTFDVTFEGGSSPPRASWTWHSDAKTLVLGIGIDTTVDEAVAAFPSSGRVYDTFEIASHEAGATLVEHFGLLTRFTGGQQEHAGSPRIETEGPTLYVNFIDRDADLQPDGGFWLRGVGPWAGTWLNNATFYAEWRQHIDDVTARSAFPFVPLSGRSVYHFDPSDVGTAAIGVIVETGETVADVRAKLEAYRVDGEQVMETGLWNGVQDSHPAVSGPPVNLGLFAATGENTDLENYVLTDEASTPDDGRTYRFWALVYDDDVDEYSIHISDGADLSDHFPSNTWIRQNNWTNVPDGFSVYIVGSAGGYTGEVTAQQWLVRTPDLRRGFGDYKVFFFDRAAESLADAYFEIDRATEVVRFNFDPAADDVSDLEAAWSSLGGVSEAVDPSLSMGRYHRSGAPIDIAFHPSGARAWVDKDGQRVVVSYSPGTEAARLFAVLDELSGIEVVLLPTTEGTDELEFPEFEKPFGLFGESSVRMGGLLWSIDNRHGALHLSHESVDHDWHIRGEPVTPGVAPVPATLVFPNADGDATLTVELPPDLAYAQSVSGGEITYDVTEALGPEKQNSLEPAYTRYDPPLDAAIAATYERGSLRVTAATPGAGGNSLGIVVRNATPPVVPATAELDVGSTGINQAVWIRVSAEGGASGNGVTVRMAYDSDHDLSVDWTTSTELVISGGATASPTLRAVAAAVLQYTREAAGEAGSGPVVRIEATRGTSLDTQVIFAAQPLFNGVSVTLSGGSDQGPASVVEETTPSGFAYLVISHQRSKTTIDELIAAYSGDTFVISALGGRGSDTLNFTTETRLSGGLDVRPRRDPPVAVILPRAPRSSLRIGLIAADGEDENTTLQELADAFVNTSYVTVEGERTEFPVANVAFDTSGGGSRNDPVSHVLPRSPSGGVDGIPRGPIEASLVFDHADGPHIDVRYDPEDTLGDILAALANYDVVAEALYNTDLNAIPEDTGFRRSVHDDLIGFPVGALVRETDDASKGVFIGVRGTDLSWHLRGVLRERPEDATEASITIQGLADGTSVRFDIPEDYDLGPPETVNLADIAYEIEEAARAEVKALRNVGSLKIESVKTGEAGDVDRFEITAGTPEVGATVPASRDALGGMRIESARTGADGNQDRFDISYGTAAVPNVPARDNLGGVRFESARIGAAGASDIVSYSYGTAAVEEVRATADVALATGAIRVRAPSASNSGGVRVVRTGARTAGAPGASLLDVDPGNGTVNIRVINRQTTDQQGPFISMNYRTTRADGSVWIEESVGASQVNLNFRGTVTAQAVVNALNASSLVQAELPSGTDGATTVTWAVANTGLGHRVPAGTPPANPLEALWNPTQNRLTINALPTDTASEVVAAITGLAEFAAADVTLVNSAVDATLLTTPTTIAAHVDYAFSGGVVGAPRTPLSVTDEANQADTVSTLTVTGVIATDTVQDLIDAYTGSRFILSVEPGHSGSDPADYIAGRNVPVIFSLQGGVAGTPRTPLAVTDSANQANTVSTLTITGVIATDTIQAVIDAYSGSRFTLSVASGSDGTDAVTLLEGTDRQQHTLTGGTTATPRTPLAVTDYETRGASFLAITGLVSGDTVQDAIDAYTKADKRFTLSIASGQAGTDALPTGTQSGPLQGGVDPIADVVSGILLAADGITIRMQAGDLLSAFNVLGGTYPVNEVATAFPAGNIVRTGDQTGAIDTTESARPARATGGANEVLAGPLEILVRDADEVDGKNVEVRYDPALDTLMDILRVAAVTPRIIVVEVYGTDLTAAPEGVPFERPMFPGGGTTGGLPIVATDATIHGDGTPGSPLGVEHPLPALPSEPSWRDYSTDEEGNLDWRQKEFFFETRRRFAFTGSTRQPPDVADPATVAAIGNIQGTSIVIQDGQYRGWATTLPEGLRQFVRDGGVLRLSGRFNTGTSSGGTAVMHVRDSDRTRLTDDLEVAVTSQRSRTYGWSFELDNKSIAAASGPIMVWLTASGSTRFFNSPEGTPAVTVQIVSVGADAPEWDDITDKPTEFPPEAHTHPWDQVTGKPSEFPPAAHTHPWNQVTGKPTDAEVGDTAFSNPPADLDDTEKAAARNAIGAGTGDGGSADSPAYDIVQLAVRSQGVALTADTEATTTLTWDAASGRLAANAYDRLVLQLEYGGDGTTGSADLTYATMEKPDALSSGDEFPLLVPDSEFSKVAFTYDVINQPYRVTIKLTSPVARPAGNTSVKLRIFGVRHRAIKGDKGDDATPYTDEQARDAVAAFVREGSNITITHDDDADTLTIAADAESLDADQFWRVPVTLKQYIANYVEDTPLADQSPTDIPTADFTLTANQDYAFTFTMPAAARQYLRNGGELRMTMKWGLHQSTAPSLQAGHYLWRWRLSLADGTRISMAPTFLATANELAQSDGAYRYTPVDARTLSLATIPEDEADMALILGYQGAATPEFDVSELALWMAVAGTEADSHTDAEIGDIAFSNPPADLDDTEKQAARNAIEAAAPDDIPDPVTSLPWGSVTGKPAAFPPQAHTHPWAQVTGKPTEFPPAAHQHPWSQITGKPEDIEMLTGLLRTINWKLAALNLRPEGYRSIRTDGNVDSERIATWAPVEINADGSFVSTDYVFYGPWYDSQGTVPFAAGRRSIVVALLSVYDPQDFRITYGLPGDNTTYAVNGASWERLDGWTNVPAGYTLYRAHPHATNINSLSPVEQVNDYRVPPDLGETMIEVQHGAGNPPVFVTGNTYAIGRVHHVTTIPVGRQRNRDFQVPNAYRLIFIGTTDNSDWVETDDGTWHTYDIQLTSDDAASPVAFTFIIVEA